METHLVWDDGWYARQYNGNEIGEEWTFDAERDDSFADVVYLSACVDDIADIRVYRDCGTHLYEFAYNGDLADVRKEVG